MLEVNSITKVYGPRTVLKDVSFTAGKGEIIGLLGPNGAGKSTTMNIMTGFISATSGCVKYDGLDILEQSTEAKKRFGYLPETPPLYNDMTVGEYLDFVYNLKKTSLNRKKHIAEVVEVTRTDEVMQRNIGVLSRGFRQRVGMAAALIGNPEIIILDEPTAGLDPAQIVETRNLVRILGREHTVILSSHLINEIQAVADRILVLSDGRLIADERAADIAGRRTEKMKLRLQVAGPKKEVSSFLRSKDGVDSVVSEKDLGDGSAEFIIETTPGVDIRKNLFFALSEHRWPLLLLEPEGASLEEIFLSITGYNKNKDKKKKAGGRR